MRRVLVTACAVSALLLGAAPGRSQSCAGVIGHRGASAVAPENTLRAVNRAAAQGAARVEVDVRRTSDGRFVLMHDAGLARTTDVEQQYPRADPWRVAATPYTRIQSLDAGSWKDGRYAGVPRVADALATGAPLLLEAKVDVGYRRVKAWAARGDVIVQTFDVAWARGFAEQYPRVPLWIISGDAVSDGEIADWSDWADGVAVRHSSMDATTVAAAHEAGMTVSAWTVDDEDAAQSLVAMGVDSIITNRVSASHTWVGC